MEEEKKHPERIPILGEPLEEIKEKWGQYTEQEKIIEDLKQQAMRAKARMEAHGADLSDLLNKYFPETKEAHYHLDAKTWELVYCNDCNNAGPGGNDPFLNFLKNMFGGHGGVH